MIGYNTAFALENSQSFGSTSGDYNTRSPIKHVIVIIGENRTFDHIFATYQAPNGEYVDNLLSKRIVNIDGTPGQNYSLSTQYRASDTSLYSIAPTKVGPYDQNANKEQPAGISYAPQVPYTDFATAAWNGPGALDASVFSLTQLAQIEPDLPTSYLHLLTTGATGTASYIDTRINGYAALPNGSYPLVTSTGGSLFDAYAGSPVHRFFQMWQELDCDKAHIDGKHPSGCLADLFSWVEATVSSGSNGGSPHALKEGDIALGFFNVAKGDAPYLTKLAQDFTLADNYHQGVMGGTFANHMMLGYADALYYADKNGDPATPPFQVIENPNPWPDQTVVGANNWYTNDGYGGYGSTEGGSYVNCADNTQPGVASVTKYLSDMKVKPNCDPNAYYLVNNFAPAYTGAGVYDKKALANFVPTLAPAGTAPFDLLSFVLPPVVHQRHIGDALTQKGVSWAWFGGRWNDFKSAPAGAFSDYPNPAVAGAYIYCNICNPFLYSASTMADPVARGEHNKDVLDLYDAIANGTLPAVSFAKPSTFSDGHPASSKIDIFEGFVNNVVEKLKANEELWENTAVLVTVDEGGGYYDSGYVQPVDFFGDGTRIPLLVVSKYSKGGHVAHEYADHASVTKFIQRNWGLPTLSNRSRDNLPNPKTASNNPYVPTNGPAIGDLWSMFDFGKDGGEQR
jgi:phospholipase C